jgi:hypothetical protein
VVERRSGELAPYTTRLLRVEGADAARPAPPVARMRAVLGRVGRRLWLQLACETDPARFCVGEAALVARGRVEHLTPFVLAGGASGAVPVQIGERAVRTLRRRGVMSATVLVRVDGGGETRATRRLRR